MKRAVSPRSASLKGRTSSIFARVRVSITCVLRPKLIASVRNVHHLVEVALTANRVIVLLQSFETHLITGGTTRSEQPSENFGRDGISEDRDTDARIGNRLVQLPEMAIGEGIAAGEADVRLHRGGRGRISENPPGWISSSRDRVPGRSERS